MSLAHLGCACSHKIFSLFDSISLFFLMRRRHCRCTTSASHVVRLSLCVPYLSPLVFCCLSSDTDLLLFLYVPYPLGFLTHDAYVNKTMTYDDTTSSRRSTIYPLLTSTTDIILFYSSFVFSSTMMRYLSYRTYRCHFPPGVLGVCKGKAGACCTYTFWRSYQINQSSKVLMKKGDEANCKVVESVIRLGIRTTRTWPRHYSLILTLTPIFSKPLFGDFIRKSTVDGPYSAEQSRKRGGSSPWQARYWRQRF